MELELHLVVSAAVILGTALVALIVDYLKGNNEQLREHNIELRVRREEEHRRAALAAVVRPRVRRQASESAAGAAAAWGAPVQGGTAEARPAEPAPVRAADTPQAEGSIREVLERAAMRAARAGAEEESAPPAQAVEAGRKFPGAAVSEPPAAAHAGPADAQGEGLLEKIIAFSGAAPAAGGIEPPVGGPEAEPGTVYLPAKPPAQPAAPAERVVAVTPLRAEPGMRGWSPGVSEASTSRTPVTEPAPTRQPPAEGPLGTGEPSGGLPEASVEAPESGMEAIEALSTLVEVAVRAERETEAESAPAPAAEVCEAPEAAPGPPAEAPIAVTAVAEAEGPLGTEAPQTLEASAPPMAPGIPIAAGTVPGAATAMEEAAAATAAGAAVPVGPEAPQAVATPVAEPASAGQETPVEAVAESAGLAAPEAARLFSLTVPVRQAPPTAAEPATAAVDWSRGASETLRYRPSGLGPAGSLAELATPAEVETPRPGPLQLPAGYHGRQAAPEVLSSESLFTGFAVCISINDFERIRKSASSNAFAELMTSIEKLMRSLLREDDFGCRISDDEFVLAYPDLTGSAAQRRASHISERLWDFQLRSLGSFSVLFSWGGLDVQDEPFNEVVESAVERMNETRNSRRSGRAGLPALPKRLAS